MGVIFAKMQQMETAMDHHRQALEMQERLLGPNHHDTQATRYNLQVLEAEQEQEKNKSTFSQFRQFVEATFSDPEPRARSLISLLCEESEDINGQRDDPCCRCGLARGRFITSRGPDGVTHLTYSDQSQSTSASGRHPCMSCVSAAGPCQRGSCKLSA
eukprot:gnl/TRDRNA2_/TRDRNA2_135449_c0_seq1.p1 gnl/TRDRNA2_/TRDRNA2_135449_c0~~gnl/TRDRNA2_/TRDRNA2_135449_c0_seq1.p1  ORF type:complete len:158 (+),score=23.96 gnl/TRDRNA2_/TRDRNA2_135449_c0_seq1:567-1040(+)